MADETLMELIDAYAEARHVGGCHTYNAKTSEARAKVVASLVDGMAGWKPLIEAPNNEIVLVAAEFDGPGDWRIKCGYLDGQTAKWRVFGASWEPTHWRKLPAPPIPASKAKEL